ncbi:hypothetical protein BKA66DRAFT_460826 [Pyrenochaeta sp. MPI-SDFR-AT-0127]|nr:hypothetical protein BKA66DRAFT_460826 [Pyrenochaeta sp. MPI-SDFR-AT-0127]
MNKVHRRILPNTGEPVPLAVYLVEIVAIVANITPCTTLSPLLRLPKELRYEVYNHLCCIEPKSYPFSASPISSIDQRPPPTNLQVTCRYLRAEIQAYFFGKATVRFVAQDVLRFRQQDIQTTALNVIHRARKVEIVLHWNITSERAKADMSAWPHSMNGWLMEQVDLLLYEGKSLGLIIVSVSDSSEYVDWKSKSRMLAPLMRLRGSLRIRLGVVTAADGEEEGLRTHLEEYVKELNQPLSRTSDESSFS